MQHSQFTLNLKIILWISAGVMLAFLLVWNSRVGFARQSVAPAQQASPFHPAFTLFDSQGLPVLESGSPVSTMQTCGSCHDTEFIASHSFHASAGLDEITQPGETQNGRPWDTSNGFFGRWNPLEYRYLTPPGDERLDLSTAEWIMTSGSRHPGGGPATTSREGSRSPTWRPPPPIPKQCSSMRKVVRLKTGIGNNPAWRR